MSENSPLRHLHLPPEGRPRWKAHSATDWDLTYLYWGLRWFGDAPIPLSCREGWTYMIFLEGAPAIVFPSGEEFTARVGMGIIFHPDCIRGTRDAAGQTCKLLGWIWKTPPSHPMIQPRPGGYFVTSFTAEGLHQLEKIHAACRKEVALPGASSPLALQKDRLELDLCVLHSLDKPESANQDYRIGLAVDFLRHNPHVLDPVEKLCEYLRISPATLKRLFKTYFNQSPQAFALERRMLLARALLSTGQKMVKEVAFELGYKHPNDFSRAYHRFFKNQVLTARRRPAA